MKKIVIPIFCLLLILPLITKTSINNRNYELDATTEVYTKAEVDSKLAELRKSIESNTTSITETRNLLTTIQNSLKNYALKTALTEANTNVDSLLTIANNNTKRIDALEQTSSTSATPVNINMNNTAFALHSKSNSGGGGGITASYAQSGSNNSTNASNTTYFSSLQTYDLTSYNTISVFSLSVSGWNAKESSIKLGGWGLCLFDSNNTLVTITNQTHYNVRLIDVSSYKGNYKLGFYIISGGGTSGYGQRWSRITNGIIRLA